MTIKDANGNVTRSPMMQLTGVQARLTLNRTLPSSSHDRAGNLITKFNPNGITSFTYDKNNRLISIEQAQQIINNQIDLVVTDTSFDPTPVSNILQAGTFTISRENH